MTKTELYKKVSEKTGQNLNVSKDIVNAVFDIIEDEVKNGDGVTIPGFMNVKKEWKEDSEVRNPSNGEKIHVPGHYVVKWKTGKALKTSVAEIKK
jgi:DNA-binding protein HU-beta